MTAPARVVIVGGGVGGVSCGAALRSGGYLGDIVLVDRAAFPYDRPPLSKEYLAGTRDLASLALQQTEWYADQRVEFVGDAEVVALRPGDEGVAVELADGRTIDADLAVLAMGGRATRPPIPGADGSRVHVLRDAADADALRAALVPGARLLVVGAGLIGAEAASTARKLGCEVTLVDPADPPLVPAAGRETARWLHDQHAAYGIETMVTTVESFADTPTGITAKLAGIEEREYDAVLLGVGMTPNTGLAEAAGLEVDRGVIVDERQRTSHPRVLAIGDGARLRDRARTEHWEAAQWDGQRAAATILESEPASTGAHWWWSDRHDRHVEGVGRMAATAPAQVVVTRGDRDAGPFSVFVLEQGEDGHRVVGAVAVDDSGAVRAARRLIDRGTVVDPERLADPATDLRKLLRG